MGLQLPVLAIREKISSALTLHCRLIIQAPAGSGKSTCVPGFIMDDVVAPTQQVVVLQPRRMAARMLASHVASLHQSKIGEKVGYAIRHEAVHGPLTRILFVTEGVLLNRLLSNDPLKEIGAIVFDEFHERHLETDLSLALALQLQKNQRPDLKIAVMSATLDTVQVKSFMEPCEVVKTEGRMYPVEIRYCPPKPYETIWDVAAASILSSLNDFTEGSSLVFMASSYEIRKTIEAIGRYPALQPFEVFPLHGSLTKEEQDKAVRSGCRKIIVSTNVAETSLTIPDVRLVIDSGMARVARFDPKRAINTLFTENISQASATQRAGRAGRVAPGVCIRLWGEFEHSHRPEVSQPEIHRVDLCEAILGLLAAGVQSVNDFPWLERPTEQAIKNAMAVLSNLGAVDGDRITPLGKNMASLHLHPRFARMLMKASDLDCFAQACVVAALAQSGGVFINTSDEVILQEREHLFGNPGSDLLFEFNAWLWAGKRQFRHADCQIVGIKWNAARQVSQAALQLLGRGNRMETRHKKLPDENLTPDEAARLRECIFTGFVDYIAIRHRLNSPTCQMTKGRSGALHRDSIVQNARMVVATELEEAKTASGVRLMLRKVTEIEEEWLTSLNVHEMEERRTPLYDKEQKRVNVQVETVLEDIVLKRRSEPLDNNDLAAEILYKAIQEGELEFSQWDEEVETYVRRVNFASKHAEHYGIPAIDDEAREFIIQQAIYGCRSAKDVQKCKLWLALKAWLSYEQQAAVDLLAPTTIMLPRRKFPVKLRYDEKGDVILSETVQALYDLPLPVTVAEGKVSVVFEILAPSRRPVQITRDLDYFWKHSYLDVKKDLKGRYPKHEWR
jgi:ATP-dependent helicase HrpB